MATSNQLVYPPPQMGFHPGFDIQPTPDLGFRYGPGVFGPGVERRTLDAIRPSLRDPAAEGPRVVYGIAMDVGRAEHRAELQARMLLFGAVTYAAGRIGEEPVRSQGHVHKVSEHSGWSPPEVYEIWTGRAVVYMQEHAADNPGRCFAVAAGPGQVVVVPPGWAHATISADPAQPLTFGAWCDREYGFEYEAVRARHGLAWYPLLDAQGQLHWQANPHYALSELVQKAPRRYPDLGLQPDVPIYAQFAQDPAAVQWVSQPGLVDQVWPNFEP